ncbi:hypothetical protein Tco_0039262 [Tanacetum coccineum]
MNEDYYHEQNSCYDHNSFGFDQVQPPQYTVNHPIFNSQNDLLDSQNKLMKQMATLRELVDQAIQKKEEEKRSRKRARARDRSWKIRFEDIVVNSDDDNSSSDDDSYENIDYVDASPPDVEIVSLEVVEIVDPEVGRIDDDILLTIKDDILREKLLNVNLLIANIEALKDNPAPSSDVMTKSSSTSLNLFLEETNTFDNSSPESETFYFDLEENSSGSTTTRSDYSLPDYKAFNSDDDHIEEKNSGSTTTQSDISLSQYDSFIFDLSINPFPPADRSDFNHEEFAGELAHIISPPEHDHLCFKNEPELGDFTMDVVGDIFPTREPRVHVPNVLPTHTTLHLDTDFILLSEPLFAYIVWIFLPFLTYPVAPPYLLSCGNEDIIFDPGISNYHSFMPDVSHRSGTFIKFNDFPDCEDSRACSIHMSFTSSASFWESSMDNAKIARKRLKPDKHGHGIEKNAKEPRIYYESSRNNVMAHVEKPEKFKGFDFRYWQQKMLFYMTSLHVTYVLTDFDPVDPYVVDGQNVPTEAQVADCATKHICNSRRMFVSYQKVTEPEPMFMRNGVALKIEEKGKVILKLTFEKDLVLLNMLHVPNITKNLKYGPILSNKGFKLVFESDKFVITKGGVYVGKGYLDEGLFKLSVVTDDNVINNNNVGTSTTSVYMMNPSFLWHSRLGAPHSLWGEACLAANTILNKIPHNRVTNLHINYGKESNLLIKG